MKSFTDIFRGPSQAGNQKNSALARVLNSVVVGDCIEVLSTLPAESVDLVVTDPPYVTAYRPRDGRVIQNDDNAHWLAPAFKEIYRVLRQDSICVTFYGWPTVDLFFRAFLDAGFRPVSHLSFIKRYSSYTGYTKAKHEVAYVLAKGRPKRPTNPPSDVQEWDYTKNYWHPTQKPVSVLRPLIQAFSKPGDVVLDPFCGSGSTLLAAEYEERNYIGIELERKHAEVAGMRL
jgi:site-specific DNA-methyltransferase (adenine-specific)